MNQCPTVEQLEAFLEDRAGELQSRSITAHVAGCVRCQRTLEDWTREASTDHLLSRSPSARGLAPEVALGDSQAAFLTRLKQTSPFAGPGVGAGFPPGCSAFSLSGIAPPLVPGYEILEEIGRGGMGVIYKARQVGLNRLVALKMILQGPHAGPADLDRFRQEAEAVARLRHPNIVQIYDVGTSEGRPYLSLEFIEGHSLAHLLRGTPQPLQAAARLIETLARTMHYAHQRNIVHRDLKPGNILLQQEEGGNREEVTQPRGRDLLVLPSSCHPRITDFGLAKRLDAPAGPGSGGSRPATMSRTGEVLGTPSYMAPEQAAGRSEAIGPATDVYALGAILYELLTGRPPFRGPTPLDTVIQVVHEDPVRPRYLRSDLPRDLETICLKCLSKEPGKRYPSALALAQDLHRFLKGRPIKARPVGLAERILKWARHQPRMAALVAGIILSVVLGFAGVTWQWQEARRARDAKDAQYQAAVEARQLEAEQRGKARALLYYSRISQSQLQWRVNDTRSARLSLGRCLPAAGQQDQRGWEWYYLQALFTNDLFTCQHEQGGNGGSVAYDPEGRRIASVVRGPPAGGVAEPGEVRIWDAARGQVLRTFLGPNTLHRLVFSPDGQRLALATMDGSVMIWDASAGKREEGRGKREDKTLPLSSLIPLPSSLPGQGLTSPSVEVFRQRLHDQLVSDLAFSPDGRHVASASWDRTVKIWNSRTGEVIQELKGHEDRIQSVAFHPDGNRIASGSWDTTIKVWDPKTGRELQTLRGHRKPVYCVTFSPKGQLLVSAASNGNLRIWDLASGRSIQSLTSDTGGVLSIAFSPDERYLAKGGKDGTVRVWDLESGEEKMCFRGHTAPVEGVHFSPDCQRLVSISPLEGLIKVWDMTRHPEYATFARTEADAEALAFHEDGRRLLSITLAGRLQSWDLGSGMLLEECKLPLHPAGISPAVPVAFAPGGRWLAARCETDATQVRLWDTTRLGAPSPLDPPRPTEVTFRGHAWPVCCVRFSADGHYLATSACETGNATGRHEIKVWPARPPAAVSDGESPLASLSGKGKIFNLAFSPDSRWLAWGGQDGVVTLADWRASSKSAHLAGHQGDVSSIAFSPDGKRLASAGFADRTVRIWDVSRLGTADPQLLHTLPAPVLLGDLAFSPDGRRLAAISRDLLKIWEIETGQEVLTLRGAPQRYWDPSFNPRLVFSPDGCLLAGTNWNESISLWEAPAAGGENSEERLLAYRMRRRQQADQRAGFWHLQEAEHCLEHSNIPAAQFHLQRLGTGPLPQPLQMRRDRLARRLETEPEQ